MRMTVAKAKMRATILVQISVSWSAHRVGIVRPPPKARNKMSEKPPARRSQRVVVAEKLKKKEKNR